MVSQLCQVLIHERTGIQLMQCRSEHTLPVTCIHIGAGQVNALAITSSLDRSCKIWGLAQGEYYKFFLEIG